MSLNRMALRLALTCALSNNFTTPYPTLAEDRVFESSNEPPTDLDDTKIRPEITIYTDDDDGESLDDQSGSPFTRTLDVVIECYVPIWTVAKDEDGRPVPSLDLAYTDPELEAQIDLMEHQVRFCLENPLNPWSVLLRGHKGLMPKILNWNSGRWADATGTKVRFAYRIIKLTVEIPDDPPLKVMTLPDIAGENVPQTVFQLPETVQKLLDRINADLDEEGKVKGYVAPLVAILEAVGTPTAITAPAMTGIQIKTKSGDDQSPVTTTFIETKP